MLANQRCASLTSNVMLCWGLIACEFEQHATAECQELLVFQSIHAFDTNTTHVATRQGEYF